MGCGERVVGIGCGGRGLLGGFLLFACNKLLEVRLHFLSRSLGGIPFCSVFWSASELVLEVERAILHAQGGIADLGGTCVAGGH